MVGLFNCNSKRQNERSAPDVYPTQCKLICCSHCNALRMRAFSALTQPAAQPDPQLQSGFPVTTRNSAIEWTAGVPLSDCAPLVGLILHTAGGKLPRPLCC